jgi:DNA helicase-2/ATP-dependent DNA helicase PcrA
MQLKKKCFSEGERGELIELISAYTEQEEGSLVASSIMAQVRRTQEPYSSFAILYRTNAQSRVIEEALRKRNMPYRIFAGHSFYERAEVKDMLAYLKLVSNIKDDEAFKRVVNFPARGIGDTSLGRLKEAAAAKELSMFEAVKTVNLAEFGIKQGTATKMKHFIEGIEALREKMDYTDAYTLAMEVNSRFGILDYMKLDTTLEAQGRVQNVEELFNSIKEFVEDGEEEYEQLAQEGEDIPIVTLDLYLENVSLISDLDGKETEDDKNKIALMTVHSSKGLEFPYVYIVGMEENLFPSQGMGMATEQDMEEERRLFYVAVTRAGKGVKLSFAQSRTKWGNHVSNPPSRFIKEIDKEYILNPLTDWEEELSTKYDDFSSSRQYPSSRTSQGGVPQRGGQGYPSQRFPGRQGTPVQGANAGRPGGSGYQGAGSGAQQRVNPPAGFVPQRKAAPANFTPDSPAVVEVGQTIEHDRFGIGVVISLEGDVTSRKAVVDFRDSGQKTLLLKFAKFRVVAR